MKSSRKFVPVALVGLAVVAAAVLPARAFHRNTCDASALHTMLLVGSRLELRSVLTDIGLPEGSAAQLGSKHSDVLLAMTDECF